MLVGRENSLTIEESDKFDCPIIRFRSSDKNFDVGVYSYFPSRETTYLELQIDRSLFMNTYNKLILHYDVNKEQIVSGSEVIIKMLKNLINNTGNY